MKNKIKSQRGASITFALLLFLVCSVLSGVIIVAATVASGRMDQIAESDQRYYAVTSAAELLKDELDGKTVTVKSVAMSEATNTVVDGEETSGEPVSASGSPVVKIWYGDTPADEYSAPQLNDGEAVKTLSVLGSASYRIAKKKDSNLFDIPAEVLPDTPLALTAEVTDTTVTDVFAVNILAQAKPDEDALVFYISKSDIKGKNSYWLKATYKADVKTNVDEQTNTGTPTEISNDGKNYKVKIKKTTTTETKMKWTLTGIVKSSVPD